MHTPVNAIISFTISAVAFLLILVIISLLWKRKTACEDAGFSSISAVPSRNTGTSLLLFHVTNGIRSGKGDSTSSILYPIFKYSKISYCEVACMKSLKYFNKGHQSSLLVPFLFANCLLTFLALARRFGIPVYFPGQHIPVSLTANTFIAPLPSGIIAFLLAPSAPIQERLAVRKVRSLSSLILFMSTAVVCVENIPLA